MDSYMSDNEAQHRTPCLNREQHVPGEACGYMRVEGLCGIYGNPAKDACPPGQCDRRARQEAREDSLRMSPTDLKQAQRIAEGLGMDEEASRLGRAASAARDPLSYAMNGATPNVAQMARAPGKMFSRSDILAVLRGLAAELTAQGIHSAGLLALDRARTVFEHLE